MPTLAEIREQYPQYGDMSDQELADALHSRFYSDIPRADFDQRIGIANAPPQDRTVRGAILPFERNLDTGEISVAVPAVGDAIINALKLPGDVASGDTPVRDPSGQLSREVIERSADLAAIASPASAGRVPAVNARPMTREVPLTQGQQVAVSADRLGVQLPRAVASDNLSTQRMGQVLSNVPVAGNPLVKASQRAISGLDEAATRIQDDLGAGSRSVAGVQARAQVTDTIKNTMKSRMERLYDPLDDLIDDAVTRPLQATKNVTDDIIRKRDAAALSGEGAAVGTVRDALARREGLSYRGLKDLRSSVGEMLDGDTPLPANMSERELKRIYGALTDDLRQTVRAAGGKAAVSRFDSANKAAKRIARERQELNRILGTRGTSDEAVFENVLALASNANRSGNINRLQLARRSIGNEAWQEIASASISKMGRAPDGSFAPGRFLTAYGRLSSQGRRVLFGRTTQSALDDLARVSTRFEELKRFGNPSGTAQTLTGQSFIAAGAAAAVGAMTMSPLPLLTLATTVSGGNIAARILAKPVAAKQVAKWATAYSRSVTNPSQAAAAALADTSRTLSLTIARESGGALSAAHLQPMLQGITKGTAVDGNQNGPAAQEVPARGPEDYDPRFDL